MVLSCLKDVSRLSTLPPSLVEAEYAVGLLLPISVIASSMLLLDTVKIIVSCIDVDTLQLNLSTHF